MEHDTDTVVVNQRRKSRSTTSRWPKATAGRPRQVHGLARRGPANPVTVDYATANGTATAPGDYAAATGTVTFAPGDTSETVTVQVNGDTAVEPNETFNVNLSNATGNATILDDQGAQDDHQRRRRRIGYLDQQRLGDRGRGGGLHRLARARPAAPVTVDYATTNNSAVAPGDYTAATGTVTFAPGDTSEPVSVTTIDDALVEGDETFAVNLSNAGGNAAILDGIGVGTILDNDVAEPQRQISINDVTVTEGNSGVTPAEFTVSLDAASANPITVDFATANGTATAPGDYTAATGTVTFAPGDTSETVTVQVNGDALVEPDETFDVNLSNATGNAAILDGTGVGTITNDDVAASESRSTTPRRPREGRSEFTVSLSAPQAAPVTVDYATANGTRRGTRGLHGGHRHGDLRPRRHLRAGLGDDHRRRPG